LRDDLGGYTISILRAYYLVPKLGWGTPFLAAKLSLATIFVPKYNLGTSGKM
jgi:hypothetical protein